MYIYLYSCLNTPNRRLLYFKPYIFGFENFDLYGGIYGLKFTRNLKLNYQVRLCFAMVKERDEIWYVVILFNHWPMLFVVDYYAELGVLFLPTISYLATNGSLCIGESCLWSRCSNIYIICILWLKINSLWSVNMFMAFCPRVNPSGYTLGYYPRALPFLLATGNDTDPTEVFRQVS